MAHVMVQSRTATDKALQALLDRGIPTFAASGDDGARDNDPNHNMGKNADYPASSPYSFGEQIGCVPSFASKRCQTIQRVATGLRLWRAAKLRDLGSCMTLLCCCCKMNSQLI